ncbi:hypothetical protein [Massilia sp.]|uniref:hypothetical protein n=1 Tax=Massilia sp. TaxID=1882437 RepID=UPI0028AB3558|nr:hypothetical protein [Massilia sp.]
MQLLPQQQNVNALRDLASAGVDLLATGQFELLVERYGYAVACGRNPVDAVMMDLAEALSETSGNKLLQMGPNDLSVVFCQQSDSGLQAAIDCEVTTQAGKNIWVSFVVTGTEAGQFLILEEICAEPGSD